MSAHRLLAPRPLRGRRRCRRRSHLPRASPPADSGAAGHAAVHQHRGPGRGKELCCCCRRSVKPLPPRAAVATAADACLPCPLPALPCQLLAAFRPLAEHVGANEAEALIYESLVSNSDPLHVVIFERCVPARASGAAPSPYGRAQSRNPPLKGSTRSTHSPSPASGRRHASQAFLDSVHNQSAPFKAFIGGYLVGDIIRAGVRGGLGAGSSDAGSSGCRPGVTLPRSPGCAPASRRSSRPSSPPGPARCCLWPAGGRRAMAQGPLRPGVYPIV